MIGRRGFFRLLGGGAAAVAVAKLPDLPEPAPTEEVSQARTHARNVKWGGYQPGVTTGYQTALMAARTEALHSGGMAYIYYNSGPNAHGHWHWQVVPKDEVNS